MESTAIKIVVGNQSAAVNTAKSKVDVVKGLEDLRKSFEFAGAKTPVEDIKVSLGFTLFDICGILGLSEAETNKVIGVKAARRIRSA